MALALKNMKASGANVTINPDEFVRQLKERSLPDVSVFFVSFLPGIILLLSSLSKNLTTSRRRFSLDSTRFLNIGKESNFFEHPLAMK
jgi:hypothetical protein